MIILFGRGRKIYTELKVVMGKGCEATPQGTGLAGEVYSHHSRLASLGNFMKGATILRGSGDLGKENVGKEIGWERKEYLNSL